MAASAHAYSRAFTQGVALGKDDPPFQGYGITTMRIAHFQILLFHYAPLHASEMSQIVSVVIRVSVAPKWQVIPAQGKALGDGTNNT